MDITSIEGFLSIFRLIIFETGWIGEDIYSEL
jgi:hypothetical protein